MLARHMPQPAYRSDSPMHKNIYRITIFGCCMSLQPCSFALSRVQYVLSLGVHSPSDKLAKSSDLRVESDLQHIRSAQAVRQVKLIRLQNQNMFSSIAYLWMHTARQTR